MDKKKSFSGRALNALVVAGIALTLFALLAAPAVLTAFFKASAFGPASDSTVPLLTAALYLCAAPYVLALFKLRGICRLVSGGEAFSPKVAAGFTAIAVCCFAEAALFLAVEIVSSTVFHAFLLALTVIPSFVVPFVCVTGGLLSLVFAGIFRSAAALKEENDLTF